MRTGAIVLPHTPYNIPLPAVSSLRLVSGIECPSAADLNIQSWQVQCDTEALFAPAKLSIATHGCRSTGAEHNFNGKLSRFE